MTDDYDPSKACVREIWAALRAHCDTYDEMLGIVVPMVGVMLQEMPQQKARAMLRLITDTLMNGLGMEAGKRARQ